MREFNSHPRLVINSGRARSFGRRSKRLRQSRAGATYIVSHPIVDSFESDGMLPQRYFRGRVPVGCDVLNQIRINIPWQGWPVARSIDSAYKPTCVL